MKYNFLNKPLKTSFPHHLIVAKQNIVGEALKFKITNYIFIS